MENVKSKVKSLASKVGVITGLSLLASSAFAAPVVTEVVAEIDAAKTPIAAVAGASLSAYVGIRVWKLVRRAI